jgi:DNA-nicking Smr family endonuclease
LNNKISDKDKKDWQIFISNKNKLNDKDSQLGKKKTEKRISKTIDLHGLSLENANKVIEEFIKECFEKGINKIVIITGKGLRSQNNDNPYVSKDLSILKNSVPEYIKSKVNLMRMIKEIKEADIKDGGQGAFYILLKKFK